jgi:hypothetical protein
MLPVQVRNVAGTDAEITGAAAEYYNITSADVQYYWHKL